VRHTDRNNLMELMNWVGLCPGPSGPRSRPYAPVMLSQGPLHGPSQIGKVLSILLAPPICGYRMCELHLFYSRQ